MEGYRVISSKKVSLCDIEDKQEQKVDNSSRLEEKGIEVIEIPCSPLLFDVVELLSDDDNDSSNNNNDNKETSCEDNSLEVLGYLTNNDSNTPIEPEVIITCDKSVDLSGENVQSNTVQQNSPRNNYFGFETAHFDQSNLMQHGELITSNELYIDQNSQLQNEDLDNCTEYFTIDFIASPSESNSAIDLPDADESTEMLMCSDTDDASENGDTPAIARRGGKIPCQSSIEPYTSYICPQCGIDCGPYNKWKLHTETEHGFGLLEAANVQSVVNKHGELCHKCRDCPKIFKLTKGFSALILHRIVHLPFKDYIACRFCSVRYRSKTTLKKHLQRKHKDLNLNTMNKFQDSALEHIRLFCPVCKEEQSNASNWRAHMKEQHDYFNKARSKFELESNNIYICTICKLKVREMNIVQHIQTHEDFKPFLCTYCNESTSQLRSALSHVRNKHLRTPKELLWRCHLCKASFNSPRRRRKHYIVQHKVVFQTCQICKKTFDSSSSLLSHMNLKNHHTLKSRT